ncbi:hypothetical protein TorRG33x02_248630 [Trema orientale]|uniref:Uncharacterized protein n=1 Tax=Trema orientale TaxID=63057 RepID=A0A2P5DKH7_TREOI|nr:hypothetical protein TorRG33x02_248630 [Trema orientale]
MIKSIPTVIFSIHPNLESVNGCPPTETKRGRRHLNSSPPYQASLARRVDSKQRNIRIGSIKRLHLQSPRSAIKVLCLIADIAVLRETIDSSGQLAHVVPSRLFQKSSGVTRPNRVMGAEEMTEFVDDRFNMLFQSRQSTKVAAHKIDSLGELHVDDVDLPFHGIHPLVQFLSCNHPRSVL